MPSVSVARHVYLSITRARGPPHTQFLAWPVDNVCRTAVAVRQRSRAATLASTVGLVMVTGRC